MDSNSLIRTPGTHLPPAGLAPPPSPLYLQAAIHGSRETSIADYWHILVKRRWLALSSAFIVVAVVAAVNFRMQPQYEAVGRIAVYRDNTDRINLKGNDTNGGGDIDDDYVVAVATHVKLLQSKILALQVIKALQLDKNPDFAGPVKVTASGKSEGIPLAHQTRNFAQEEFQIAKFLDNEKVSILPETRLLEIRFLSPDPKLSTDVVNTLANTYVEQTLKAKFDSTVHASEWLSRQLLDLQLKVETSEQKLVDYQKTHGIWGLDEKQNTVTVKLDELNKELTAAEAQRIERQSRSQLIASADNGATINADPSTLIEKLRSRQADLNDQYAQLTSQFGSSYPRVIEIGEQLKQVEAAIRSESARMAANTHTEFLAALQRENLLRAALETQKQHANTLNKSAIEYTLLKRDAESNRLLYDGLQQKLKEASVLAGLKSTNIRIVDPARIPLAPATPNIPRNLALGLIVGLAGGIAVVFLVESMDTTLSSVEEVQAIAALPALATIPFAKRTLANGNNPVTIAGASFSSPARIESAVHFRPKSEIAESYRALRTSILLSSPGESPKVLLVTSALPQEGKTTTSINTAMVLAQRGSRVLLVDADLRHPGVQGALNIEVTNGLSSVLSGGHSTDDAILSWPELPNLSVMPAGVIPPHPAELLGSTWMKDLIAQWRLEFDHIVIDTPPVLAVTDAVLLSVQADAVLLVIRSQQTTKGALQRACGILRNVQANVMGIVINGESHHATYYYYGSKYGRKYYSEHSTKGGIRA